MIGVSYGTDVTIVPIHWPTAKRGSEEDNADDVLVADMIDLLAQMFKLIIHLQSLQPERTHWE